MLSLERLLEPSDVIGDRGQDGAEACGNVHHQIRLKITDIAVAFAMPKRPQPVELPCCVGGENAWAHVRHWTAHPAQERRVPIWTIWNVSVDFTGNSNQRFLDPAVDLLDARGDSVDIDPSLDRVAGSGKEGGSAQARLLHHRSFVLRPFEILPDVNEDRMHEGPRVQAQHAVRATPRPSRRRRTAGLQPRPPQGSQCGNAVRRGNRGSGCRCPNGGDDRLGPENRSIVPPRPTERERAGPLRLPFGLSPSGPAFAPLGVRRA